MGAQTPQFANRVLRAVTSDWRVSGIVSMRSGTRLNIVSGRDNAFTGILLQRVNQVSDDVYGPKTLRNYLNAAAFAQPAAGTQGSIRRNSLTGPGYRDVSVALSRLVAVAGTNRLELRLEAFNLLNTFNWGDPVTNRNQGTFGRITSIAGAPRIMQFGIKYDF